MHLNEKETHNFSLVDNEEICSFYFIALTYVKRKNVFKNKTISKKRQHHLHTLCKARRRKKTQKIVCVINSDVTRINLNVSSRLWCIWALHLSSNRVEWILKDRSKKIPNKTISKLNFTSVHDAMFWKLKFICQMSMFGIYRLFSENQSIFLHAIKCVFNIFLTWYLQIFFLFLFAGCTW